MTLPLFDKPQFKLTPDAHRRQYATIDNELMIYTGGTDRVCPVKVPAELFSIMRYMGIDRETEVRLYLDDMPEVAGRMVFGLWVDDSEARDLWYAGRSDMKHIITVSTRAPA